MTVGYNDLSPEALQGVRLWLEQNPPAIPIGNILGYNQFVAATQQATVATAEATTSATYGNLTTAGPTISNLPAGKYIVLFSCQAAGDGPTTVGPTTFYTFPYASIKYGTAEAVDADAIIMSGNGAGAYVSISGFKVVSLPATKNTVTMRYRKVGAGFATVGAQFQNRQLTVLRYATL